MQRSLLRAAPILIAAALFAGCGGGGGSSSTPSVPGGGGGSTPTPTPTGGSSNLSIPGTNTVNTGTTYTVYSASLGGTTQIAITPYNAGPPDSVNGWSVVTTGAEITYPDFSVQLSDVAGNFDVSQSSWAQSNLAALAANPQLQPEVIVSLLGIAPQAPLDTTVVAYAANGGSTATASGLRSAMDGRRAQGAQPTAELASVAIFPRGIAMFDNETRTFTLAGSDSDGQYVDLSKAQVQWSVKGCNGGPGAGSVTVKSATDSSRAVYKPPTSGTFSCPDIVSAVVTSAGLSYTTTANAFYYDPSAGVQWSGTLADGTGKPVTSGLVYLYGGGREFYRGNLVAFTNSSGQFSRTIPPNRSMVPIGGNFTVAGGKASASFFTLNPGTVTAGAPGSTIPAATYTEGGAFVNPFKPLPAFDRALRDSYFITGVALDQFPFSRSNSSGAYGKCSIDAIINGQANSTACATVGDNGYFNGWSVTKVSSSPNTWVFQQPSSQEGGRHALQVAAATSVSAPNGISDSVTKAVTCAAAGNACFNYLRVYSPIGFTAPITGVITSNNGTLSGVPAGTILAVDGGFDEIANTGGVNGAFTAYYVRNEYTVGHQVQGSPLYTHTMSFQYASAGATNATIANTWYNAAGLTAGTLTVTFTPNATLSPSAPAGSALWTYTGTGTRQYYKGTAPSAQVGYTISGQVNNDHTASSAVTITASPDSNAVGVKVSETFLGIPAACPSGFPAPVHGSVARICATLDSPNVTGLTTSHVATYTVDVQNTTSVLLDPGLGAQAAAFQL